MNKFAGYIVALLVGTLIGYFGGREHLKYEMRSAFSSAAEGFSESLSAIGGNQDRPRVTASGSEESGPSEAELRAEANAYTDQHIELYDLSAKYIDTYLNERVPGVLFKLKNNGERSLDRVEVTVYFKNADGQIIAEEDFHPVLVSTYSMNDSKPLRPGYIWQMESGKYYTAKQVPSEWQEGSIEASVTDVRFSE